MQLSEIFRRGVVVPCNERSLQHLLRWDISSSILVDFLPILNQDSFESIWSVGIFQKLNMACSVSIGDYEEEILNADEISTAITEVRSVDGIVDEYVRGFIEDFLILLLRAQRENMPVFFIL